MAQTSYLTNQPIGFAGMKADLQGNDNVDSKVNAEASAGMPFGIFVVKKASGGNQAVILPATNATLPVVGMVLHSHSFSVGSTGELLSTGLVPNTVMDVMTRGRALVIAENGSAYGDAVWIRYAGAGQKGGVRNAGVASENFKLNNARFLTASSAGGVAEIEFDVIGGATAGS